ncbi:MAG: ATP-binding protein [Pyrinomonadaceae bacterium]|nr:ATP-binding protein [Pyrinomonadaceae bacterium]MBP6212113.1 ATP-binding protein [Pyrinomonadaceae bacterium]
MPQDKKKDHVLKAVPKLVTLAPPTGDGIEMDVCQICFGTGLEVVPGKGARRCVCRKRDTHVDQITKAQIPKRYEKCHFNTYKTGDNVSQKIALRIAQDFTNQFPAVDSGLLLSGTVGVGKTHLAVSILKGLTERGFACLFYEFGTLLKEIQDSYNPKTFSSELGVLSPVLNADILVLDELGASKPTDWVRDTLSHIINSRYNEKKFTIFTTNYLDERPTDREETLEDRIGVRARSRIYEMCQTVVITGEDHRRKLHQQSGLGRLGSPKR